MRFFLGTRELSWLGKLDIPLCISLAALHRVRRLKPARAPWVLDSGAFSELTRHATWSVPVQPFVERVRRALDQAGMPEWVGIQDWMCEPGMLRATGLTVAEHQARTLASYGELTARAPEVPWLPTLQGWTPEDFIMHQAAYAAAGWPLARAARVGLGSVCRRTTDFAPIPALIRRLAADGLRLHGFGVKAAGLAACASSLASADSMAWCRRAQWARGRLCGTAHGARRCMSCLPFALQWRARVVAATSQQELAW